MCKWGIKQRVLSLTILPTVVISLFMGIYFISVRVTELHQGIIDRGTAAVSQLATLAQNGVFTGDYDSLRQIARKELTKEISSIVFFNKNGSEIASAGKLSSSISPENLQENKKIITIDYQNSKSFITPISLPEIIIDDEYNSEWSEYNNANSSIIGWVKIELEYWVTNIKIYRILLHVILVILLGLTISGLIAFRMANIITQPILAITDAVAKIKRGELNTRIDINAKWELAILKSGINTMARSLENAHQEMQEKIDHATTNLRKTLETIEIQNIELESARSHAENLNNAKSEFLANMSHELRTPLNGMLGFINLLYQTKLNNEQLEFLNIVKKSAKNLLGIINDILDFSKIEAGKLEISYEPMDLYECIEDAITLLSPNAHEKNLEIIPLIYSEVPKKIIGDSLRIKQVITNLISNAIKFTKEGSVVIRAMIQNSTKHDISICISITDTGIGLNEEQKQNIFNAFSQASPSIAKKFGGTGLGLVICKKLVEQMEGKIGVESSLNNGATFWFTFKAKKIKTNSIRDSDSLLTNKKIILFDEHQTTRLSLLHLLTSWNIDIIETNDLEEIITKSETEPDCALVIIGISQNTIETVFKETVEKLNKKNIKIITLINSTSRTKINKILNSNVSLCLSKPVTRKKLYNSLCELLTLDQNEKTSNSSENNNINKNFNKIEPLLKDINVITVDDNYANLKLVYTILEKHGAKVTIVSSGEAAIKITNQIAFDIIFMDLNMQGIDGISATKIIRKNSKFNIDTPIIAISAYISDAAKNEILSSGMQGYLTKPITEEDLISTIKKWCKKTQALNKLQSYTNNDYLDTNLNNTEFHSNMKNNQIYNNILKFNLENGNSSSIDWNLCLKQAAGNKTLAKELLDMLIDSIPEERQNINSSFHKNNWEDLKHYVHKLHGACCYCGVPKLKNILMQLEKDIEKTNIKNIEIGIKIFNKEIESILQEKDKVII